VEEKANRVLFPLKLTDGISGGCEKKIFLQPRKNNLKIVGQVFMQQYVKTTLKTSFFSNGR